MLEVQKEAQLTRYPPDKTHLGRGLSIAIGLHFFFAVVTCLVLYLLGIVSLKELLEKGGSLASSGPAPEEEMVVELKLEDVEPPPTDQVEFIKQILKPKPPDIVKPPPKPPEPISQPIVKTKPKYTAPKATGLGNSPVVSAFVLGSSGLPAPGYPLAALQAGQRGTVMMRVTFDSSGAVGNAEIASSSGVELLDTWTRDFIYGHWKNASLAGRTVSVPIVYDPTIRPAH